MYRFTVVFELSVWKIANDLYTYVLTSTSYVSHCKAVVANSDKTKDIGQGILCATPLKSRLTDVQGILGNQGCHKMDVVNVFCRLF